MDKVALKAEMKKSGMRMDDIARGIGLHPSSLFRKMHTDDNSFTVAEAQKLTEMLEIEPEKAYRIFFT